MIYLGKARIITDVFMRMERGDIVDLYAYSHEVELIEAETETE